MEYRISGIRLNNKENIIIISEESKSNDSQIRSVSLRENNNDLNSKIKKDPERSLTNHILNYYTENNLEEKDAISLAEDISVALFSFLTKVGLNRYKPELISVKLLTEISHSDEFKEIKNLVGKLKVILI